VAAANLFGPRRRREIKAPNLLAAAGGSLNRQARVAGHEARVAAANLFGPRRRREIKAAKFSVAVGDVAFGSIGPGKYLTAETGYTMPATTLVRHMSDGVLTIKVAYARETGATLGAQVYGKPLVRVREAMNHLETAVQQHVPFAELAQA
ncbi:MAG: hypothetical protein H5T99_00295, partial [Moorella sp. (in: Bacteria)]|nr:hypothetical protein [Moorella sp. (in: firmicutes)]